MKIIILSTYDLKGGAAIAAFRLTKALNKIDGIEAKLLVREKSSEDGAVVQSRTGTIAKLMDKCNEFYERFRFMLQEKDKSVRFQFSIANTGQSIVNHPLVKAADVVHLHWINQGFLSLNEIGRLQKLDKALVWTLHDMWAFTGGEHYTNTESYKYEAGNSEMLKKPSENDLSHKLWKKKKSIYQKLDFVTCSKWLRDVARSSSLLKKFSVEAIPNPIDIDFYKKQDDSKFSKFSKKGKLNLLFGAFNIQDPRKGFKFLAEAISILPLSLRAEMQLVVVGKADGIEDFKLGCEYIALGTVKSDEMPDLYSISDLMVVPSLQDNLPNTIMEAMACECPVVAFRTGGIPEMIEDGVSGFLTEVSNVDALSKGIEKLMKPEIREEFSKSARAYVLKNYSETKVANQYLEHYRKLTKS